MVDTVNPLLETPVAILKLLLVLAEPFNDIAGAYSVMLPLVDVVTLAIPEVTI